MRSFPKSVTVLSSVCSVQVAPAQAGHASQHWDSILARSQAHTLTWNWHGLPWLWAALLLGCEGARAGMLAGKGEVDLRSPVTPPAPVDGAQPASSTMPLLFSPSQGSARVSPSVQPHPQPVRYAWPVGAAGGGPGSEVTVGVPGESRLWVSEPEVTKPVVGSLGSWAPSRRCGWRPPGKGQALGSSWKPALSRILYAPA